MARVKDGSHFTVKSEKDLKELSRRLIEDANGTNEFSSNNFPSDEERTRMGSDTGKVLGGLEEFLFRKNDLHIQNK